MVHDALYQLTGASADDADDMAVNSYNASFSYDVISNMTSRRVRTDNAKYFEHGPGDYVYDSGKPNAVSFVEDNGGANPIAADGRFGTFEYDDAGNLVVAIIRHPSVPLGSNNVVIEELRLTWDALGRLTYAERDVDGASTKVEFGYDFSGNRVYKRVLGSGPDADPVGDCGITGITPSPLINTKTTLYIDGNSELRGCRLTHFVMAGGRRIARLVATMDPLLATGSAYDEAYTFFYHPDHLGSTSTVTADNGELVNHTSYYPFGGVANEIKNPVWGDFSGDYKFTGKELDEEIGLVYFGARYYWPALGRWASADPLFLASPEAALPSEDNPGIRVLELNLYGYVSNNPMAYVDTAGLMPELAAEKHGEKMAEFFTALFEPETATVTLTGKGDFENDLGRAVTFGRGRRDFPSRLFFYNVIKEAAEGKEISRLVFKDHGYDGIVELGDEIVDEESFELFRPHFEALGELFAEDGLIHLQQCYAGMNKELLLKMSKAAVALPRFSRQLITQPSPHCDDNSHT